jgi:hypothetical protein
MASAARLALRVTCAAAALVAATPARIHAETLADAEAPRVGLADAEAHVIAYGTVELAGSDGERSWLDGGFGKGRYGGGSDGDFRIRPRLAEAGVVLQPRFSWALGATIVGVAQHGQDHPLDVSEAFLTYRPLPVGGVRFQVRAGLFWPNISLEHTGPEWAVRDSLTPSAINSWIGEEVKVAGVEASAATVIAGQRLTLTAALFGDNDTAGTLIAFRGWALHDEKTTLFGAQPLPPRNVFMTLVQAPVTYPAISLSPRVGFYAKLAWRPPLPVELQYFHYDNRANPQAVTPTLQWGWRTRFDHLALIVDPLPRLRLTAQALSGRTRMGFPVGDVIWVDTRFRSAFAMATWSWRRGSLSLRGEAFDTSNRGSRLVGFDDEHGKAATLAARRQITGYASLLAELVHIESDRQSRLRLAENPRQTQTIARLALRVRFKR